MRKSLHFFWKNCQIFANVFQSLLKICFVGSLNLCESFEKLQFQLERATLPNSFSSFVRKAKILHSVNFVAFTIRAFSANCVSEHVSSSAPVWIGGMRTCESWPSCDQTSKLEFAEKRSASPSNYSIQVLANSLAKQANSFGYCLLIAYIILFRKGPNKCQNMSWNWMYAYIFSHQEFRLPNK